MTDLDQLLADDADTSSCATIPDLDAALRRTQTAATRRRLVAGGTALAAVAAVGGGIYAAASPASSGSGGGPRLAAYDRVLGADPGRAEHVFVVGPDDEHVAQCTKAPGTTVQLTHSPDGQVTGYRASIPPQDGAAASQIGASGFDNLPPGPYYVFSCPSDVQQP